VEVLGSQISALYAAASSDALPPRGGDVRILHVSDIHSNPLGLEIARDLARQFDVDAILDTGDLTSFGYPVEARMGDLIREIRRPYLYVPGNHDSDANRAALDAVPNVELLDGDTTVVGGIEILGVGDPTFTATNEIDSDEAAEIRLGEAPAVAALVAREQPDVLAVHDTRVAGDSYGTVPVIVAGHRHRSKVEERDGTLVLTVGSTGATGLGAFLVKEGQPYEARLLHFRAGRLAAIDTFRLQGLSGSYDIQRRTFEPPEAGERPGPDGGEGEPEEDVSATNPR
jgi:predicted phosphodiesterase